MRVRQEPVLKIPELLPVFIWVLRDLSAGCFRVQGGIVEHILILKLHPGAGDRHQPVPVRSRCGIRRAYKTEIRRAQRISLRVRFHQQLVRHVFACRHRQVCPILLVDPVHVRLHERNEIEILRFRAVHIRQSQVVPVPHGVVDIRSAQFHHGALVVDVIDGQRGKVGGEAQSIHHAVLVVAFESARNDMHRLGPDDQRFEVIQAVEQRGIEVVSVVVRDRFVFNRGGDIEGPKAVHIVERAPADMFDPLFDFNAFDVRAEVVRGLHVERLVPGRDSRVFAGGIKDHLPGRGVIGPAAVPVLVFAAVQAVFDRIVEAVADRQQRVLRLWRFDGLRDVSAPAVRVLGPAEIVAEQYARAHAGGCVVNGGEGVVKRAVRVHRGGVQCICGRTEPPRRAIGGAEAFCVSRGRGAPHVGGSHPFRHKIGVKNVAVPGQKDEVLGRLAFELLICCGNGGVRDRDSRNQLALTGGECRVIKVVVQPLPQRAFRVVVRVKLQELVLIEFAEILVDGVLERPGVNGVHAQNQSAVRVKHPPVKGLVPEITGLARLIAVVVLQGIFGCRFIPRELRAVSGECDRAVFDAVILDVRKLHPVARQHFGVVKIAGAAVEPVGVPVLFGGLKRVVKRRFVFPRDLRLRVGPEGKDIPGLELRRDFGFVRVEGFDDLPVCKAERGSHAENGHVRCLRNGGRTAGKNRSHRL